MIKITGRSFSYALAVTGRTEHERLLEALTLTYWRLVNHRKMSSTSVDGCPLVEGRVTDLCLQGKTVETFNNVKVSHYQQLKEDKHQVTL